MTGSTSGTATLNSALDTITYRKIGSVVHVQGRIQLSSVNGASGRVRISLPFSAASLTEDGTALLTAVVYSGNKIDSGEGTIIWEIFESQNVANLYYSDGATVADVSFTTHVDDGHSCWHFWQLHISITTPVGSQGSQSNHHRRKHRWL